MSYFDEMDRAKLERAKVSQAKQDREALEPDTSDHDTYREWLDLDLAGELGDGERQRLEAHLEGCAGCRTERRSLEALTRVLAAGRVSVGADFSARVMASLPVAGWEGRSPQAWRWPLVALAALVAAVGALLGVSSAELAPSGSVAGALGAVTDLLVTGALAGAGLLGASWQGIGLIAREALGEIPGGFVAFAVLVVCLDFLLFTLVRRRAVVARADVAGDDPRR